ncbi:hypothetical protein AWG69_06395 [Escherichia coli]|nr:hypothetical protein AWG69_06395 [Escherichia coli]
MSDKVTVKQTINKATSIYKIEHITVGKPGSEQYRHAFELKWSTKTGHRVRVFSSIDFPIRLVVTHHYIRAVLVRCNIQRYSPLLRELHR